MANKDLSKLYEREGLEGTEKLLVDPDKFLAMVHWASMLK